MYVTGSYFSQGGVIYRCEHSLDSSLHPSLVVSIAQFQHDSKSVQVN
jgi:hypothetical protein